MGTKYSSTVTADLASYNSNPPPDDGSQTEANKTKWSTVKNKLGDPTKSALENLDTAITAHFNEGPTAKSAAYTTAASDYNTVLEVTGTTTISLADPTSVGAGYRVTVLNAGSNTVTVNVDGGANVDGSASLPLLAGESGTFMVDSGGTVYRSIGGQSPLARGEFVSGTKMLFYQDTAPTGWTIDTAVDNHVIELTDGSANGGATGGTTTGSVSTETFFAITATGNEASHTHTGPDHNHQWYNRDGTTAVSDKSYNSGGSSIDLNGTNKAGTAWYFVLSNTASGKHPTVDYYTDNEGTGSTSAGSSHNHAIDCRLQRAQVIIATKD